MQASFKRARSVIDELEMLQDGIADTLEGGAEGPSDGGATDETGE
jgi:holo-[acyl-carrier protein] synthase